MNYGFFSGVVCGVPSVSILPINGRDIFVCRFVIATEENDSAANKYNFYECVSFEETAKAFNDVFFKNANINVMGKIVNFQFKDNNNSPHVTQIVLAEHIEYGYSKRSDKYGKEKLCDFPIVADISEMNRLYKEICEHGFLCVNEIDYFNIAAGNMNF